MILRSGTPIDSEISHLTPRDQLNKALPRPLIDEVWFTPKHHLQVIAVNDKNDDPSFWKQIPITPQPQL